MTLLSLKLATAINREVDDTPKVIPAWIAKEMGDPQVHLFESQRAVGKAHYAKQKERRGSVRTTGKPRGRPRTRMSDDDQARLSQTLQAYLDAVK